MRDFRTGAYRHRGALASRRVTEPTLDVPGRCAARPGSAPRQPLVGRPRLPPARRRRDRPDGRDPARRHLDVHCGRSAVARPAMGIAGHPRRPSTASVAGRAWRCFERGSWACIFGAVLLIGLRRGLSPRNAALLTLGAFAVAAPALALRPQLLGMACFAILLVLVADRRRHPAVSGRSPSWRSSGPTSTAASSSRPPFSASPGSRMWPSAGRGAPDAPHRTRHRRRGLCDAVWPRRLGLRRRAVGERGGREPHHGMAADHDPGCDRHLVLRCRSRRSSR